MLALEIDIFFFSNVIVDLCYTKPNIFDDIWIYVILYLYFILRELIFFLPYLEIYI